MEMTSGRKTHRRGNKFALHGFPFLLWAGAAHGADVDSVSDRFDSFQFQESLKSPVSSDEKGDATFAFDGGAAEPLKDWTFTLNLPVSYASNPNRVDTGTLDAAHGTPAIELSWAHNFGPWKLSAKGAMNYDLYALDGVTNTTSAKGGFEVGYVLPKSNFIPYFSYVPNGTFKEFFSDDIAKQHDLSAGVKTTILAQLDQRLPEAKFSYDLRYTRRVASPDSSTQDRAILSLKGEQKLNNKMTLRVIQEFQGRFYSRSTNEGREDLFMQTGVALLYSISKSMVLTATVTFETNSSDKVTKDYSNWDVGPSIGGAWNFDL